MNKEEMLKILQDLYMINPGFRKYENDLKRIIAELLASKPKASLNPDFKERLYAELTTKIRTLESQEIKPRNFFQNFIFARKPMYVGAILSVLIIFPLIYFYYLPLGKKTIQEPAVTKIAKMPANAFGELGLEARTAAPVGRGGGGGAEMSLSKDQSQISQPVIVPPADWEAYRFVYKGEPLKLNEDKVEVLRRKKGFLNEALAATLKNYDFGLIDLSQLQNTKIQSLTVAENKENGYTVDINVNEGIISINQNWERWKMASPVETLKESDVPADSKLIQIADDFLEKYKISRENYGQPEVQNQWRIFFQKTSDKDLFYVPEIITVIYPLQINGQTVYDDGGNKHGLSVNIDIRNLRASGAWNLSAQNYESSLYRAEKDADKILKIAERGGVWGFIDPNASRIVDIDLGTPELGYMKIWNYKEGKSDELIVRAYIFPVLKQPQGGGYQDRKTVIVPLAADLLSENNSGGPITIMEKAL